MATVVREYRCVPRREIKGARCSRAEENGCAAGAVEEVKPFCCVRVPVEFPSIILV
jgi:hypothetical protein